MHSRSAQFGKQKGFAIQLVRRLPAILLHQYSGWERWCISAIAAVLMWPAWLMAADVELPRDFSVVQGDHSIFYESYTDNRVGGAGLSTELPYAGVLDIENGTVIFSGPTYQHPLFGHHTVMHETSRDLLLLHPRLSATESLAASVTFDVPGSGWFEVTGTFARANDFRLAGDGVVVMVFVNQDTASPLMQATISSDHTVDPDDPFSGTGISSFDLLVWLDPVDSLRFAVFGGSIGSVDGDFDVTALELSITSGWIFSDGFESGDLSMWSSNEASR